MALSWNQAAVWGSVILRVPLTTGRDQKGATPMSGGSIFFVENQGSALLTQVNWFPPQEDICTPTAPTPLCHRSHYTTNACSHTKSVRICRYWGRLLPLKLHCFVFTLSISSSSAPSVPQLHLQPLLHTPNFAQCQVLGCDYPSCCLGGQSHQWSSHSIMPASGRSCSCSGYPVPIAAGCLQGLQSISRSWLTPTHGAQPISFMSSTHWCPLKHRSCPFPNLAVGWEVSSNLHIELLQKKGAHSVPQSPLLEPPPLRHPLASAHFFHRSGDNSWEAANPWHNISPRDYCLQVGIVS